ncbi:hypothetical protein HGRIS_001705 [Hohenbuehelia grisea]|uniref:Secreted protein n=1 Tax=Hohenbuehelia grisea TaxID=104357 RepID=A0ABR3JIL0_9AGAR
MSRLLWFIAGAGAATWWTRSRSTNDITDRRGCGRHGTSNSTRSEVESFDASHRTPLPPMASQDKEGGSLNLSVPCEGAEASLDTVLLALRAMKVIF